MTLFHCSNDRNETDLWHFLVSTIISNSVHRVLTVLTLKPGHDMHDRKAKSDASGTTELVK